jgi:hypothetical protein
MASKISAHVNTMLLDAIFVCFTSCVMLECRNPGEKSCQIDNCPLEATRCFSFEEWIFSLSLTITPLVVRLELTDSIMVTMMAYCNNSCLSFVELWDIEKFVSTS